MAYLKRSIILITACGLANLAYAQSPQMNTTIIGSGSPDYNPKRVSAGVLITQGNTQILIDMGDGVKRNLEELNIDGRQMDALLFTHHHLDHNADFSSVFTTALLGRDNFLIAGPTQTKVLVENNIQFYEEDLNYRLSKTQRSLDGRIDNITVRELKGGDSFEVDDIKISTLSVPHTIESIAYRLDYRDQSVVVTGDLNSGPGVAEFAKGADCLIIDSGGMIMNNSRKGPDNNNKTLRSEKTNNTQRSNKQRAHLNIKESSQIAADANVGKLVYTHFVRGEIDEAASLNIIGNQYQGEVIFGADFMSLDCGVTKPNAPFAQAAPETAPIDQASYPVVSVDTAQYQKNDNNTVTDKVTGLMWQQDYKVLSFDEAVEYAKGANIGGYDDWRIPSIKELYSLILFTGVDASNRDMYKVPDGAKPFIDIDTFEFAYGTNGERVIDSQYLTTSIYTGKVMGKDKALFGVNFADGRIKGYPLVQPRTKQDNKFTVRLVRGNTDYGKNHFHDNNDQTVSDFATQLMWAKQDSQAAMNWSESKAWIAQLNKEKYLGYSDWRLPSIKELQTIVDYTRSPQATDSAAINPIFSISSIKDEQGELNYPAFWSNTTHLRVGPNPQSQAAYFCFGECLGFMKRPNSETRTLLDVHGAGAQRAEPKEGNAADYPNGHGPQGDVIRIENYARPVRDMP